MTKPQMQEQIDFLKKEIQSRIKINANVYVYYCANCGNPFLLNHAQDMSKNNAGKSFTCSAGHPNKFSR